MANLDQSFDIRGKIEEDRLKGLIKSVKNMEGVNNVSISSSGNKVIVGYTPGLVTVQRIKEIIESQGLDVSDQGDD